MVHLRLGDLVVLITHKTPFPAISFCELHSVTAKQSKQRRNNSKWSTKPDILHFLSISTLSTNSSSQQNKKPQYAEPITSMILNYDMQNLYNKKDKLRTATMRSFSARPGLFSATQEYRPASCSVADSMCNCWRSFINSTSVSFIR